MYALRMSDVNKEATYLLTYYKIVWFNWLCRCFWFL